MLSELPIKPEEYEVSHYEKVDYSLLHSEMDIIELRFINGLIRYFKPQNVIEIGVSRGGGTVNLLNAISDIPNSKLISIDRAENSFRDKDTIVPIGIDAVTVFPDLPDNRWQLITGKDPSEVMESLAIRYDFAIIDTAHLHPIESLNFLCLLPYLEDGAIVVLHDVALHLKGGTFRSYATRVLISAVAGQKLTHAVIDGDIPNIVSFQINSDTRKYIDNVFDSLLLPWGMYTRDVGTIRELLKKHYTSSQIQKYDVAVSLNRTWTASGNTTYKEEQARRMWSVIMQRHRKNEVIFYGAGTNMRSFLSALNELSISFDFTIWDRDAQRIGDINGHDVCNPDFETKVTGDYCVVVTLLKNDIIRIIKSQFESLGYTVFCEIGEFLISHGHD